jgi:hypothetical protein
MLRLIFQEGGRMKGFFNFVIDFTVIFIVGVCVCARARACMCMRAYMSER